MLADSNRKGSRSEAGHRKLVRAAIALALIALLVAIGVLVAHMIGARVPAP
jgi:hypothetical protein